MTTHGKDFPLLMPALLCEPAVNMLFKDGKRVLLLDERFLFFCSP